jgi:peptidyl-prolyl cis-trans isomerase B (cyclophilin B)
MKNINYLLTLMASMILFSSCATADKDHLITIQTRYGDMKVILFDETPLHKENFIKLAKDGKYDSTIFHRVIKNFMVQGGDVNTKPNSKDKIDYTIPAEFVDGFFHEKGALAAARMGDNVNPKKESSGCQFYIVQGKKFSNEELNQLEISQNQYNVQSRFAELMKNPNYKELRNEIVDLQKQGDYEGIQSKMLEARTTLEKEYGTWEDYLVTDNQRKIYSEVGGSPHLDGAYTVFGKVVEGIHVIDSIAAQATALGDKPVEDIYMKVLVEKLDKKKITKLYGYQYPDAKK